MKDDDTQFKIVFKSLIHNRLKFYNLKYQLLNNDDLTLAAFSNPKTKNFSHAIPDEKEDLIFRSKSAIIDYIAANKQKFNEVYAKNKTKHDLSNLNNNGSKKT